MAKVVSDRRRSAGPALPVGSTGSIIGPSPIGALCRHAGRAWLLLGLTAVTAACATAPADPAPGAVVAASVAADRPALPEPRVMARAPVPLGPADRPTTSAEIFIANLDAQRAVIAERAEAGDPRWLQSLAEMQYFEGRLYGRTSALEAAERSVARLATLTPDDPGVALLQARLHSAFHRFDEARAALARAETRQADPQQAIELRAQLELALGNVDAAETLAAQLPPAEPGSLALRANLLLERGRLAEAERLFDRAQQLHRSSNPYPLAWVQTQHGIGLLRYGQTERARDWFRAAHLRLPQFTLAAEHLAETETLLGNHAGALLLYRQVTAASDDPEFDAAMAEALRASGDEAAAAAAQARARHGYEHWLRRHPAAFWQHAAGFYADAGDPQRALALARANHGLRGDIGSLLLLAEAAGAAGDQREACAALAAARATGLQPPELAEVGSKLGDCDRG